MLHSILVNMTYHIPCLVEVRREGNYSPGDVLYTSQNNAVDVTFQTDSSVRMKGFSLDVESIPCSRGNVNLFFFNLFRLFFGLFRFRVRFNSL